MTSPIDIAVLAYIAVAMLFLAACMVEAWQQKDESVSGLVLPILASLFWPVTLLFFGGYMLLQRLKKR